MLLPLAAREALLEVLLEVESNWVTDRHVDCCDGWTPCIPEAETAGVTVDTLLLKPSLRRCKSACIKDSLLLDVEVWSRQRTLADGPATGSSRGRFFDVPMRCAGVGSAISAALEATCETLESRKSGKEEGRIVFVGRVEVDVAGFDADADKGSSRRRLFDGPAAGF